MVHWFCWRPLGCNHHWLYSVCFFSAYGKDQTLWHDLQSTCRVQSICHLVVDTSSWFEGSSSHRYLLCFFHSHEEESLHGGRLLQERVSQRPAGALQPHAGRTPPASLVHILLLLVCTFLPIHAWKVFWKYVGFLGWGFMRRITVRFYWPLSVSFIILVMPSQELAFSHKTAHWLGLLRTALALALGLALSHNSNFSTS